VGIHLRMQSKTSNENVTILFSIFNAKLIIFTVPVGSHHKVLVTEDMKIENHNKKLRQGNIALEKADDRVHKHVTALTSQMPISQRTIQHHTKGLETARKAQNRAAVMFSKVVEAGSELPSGSGKVVVGAPN
jgi:hypothetical protein